MNVKLKGQSTVEYILLLSVIMSLFYLVFKSQAWMQMFGKNSKVFKDLDGYMAHTYRYGNFSLEEIDANGGKHMLYFNPKTNTTRFFFSIKPYGDGN